jgi:hypothetical protein
MRPWRRLSDFIIDYTDCGEISQIKRRVSWWGPRNMCGGGISPVRGCHGEALEPCAVAWAACYRIGLSIFKTSPLRYETARRNVMLELLNLSLGISPYTIPFPIDAIIISSVQSSQNRWNYNTISEIITICY